MIEIWTNILIATGIIKDRDLNMVKTWTNILIDKVKINRQNRSKEELYMKTQKET